MKVSDRPSLSTVAWYIMLLVRHLPLRRQAGLDLQLHVFSGDCGFSLMTDLLWASMLLPRFVIHE